MPKANEYLTIGQTAKRSGVATSALRFYETRGLIIAGRGKGNQRIYHRSMLRRISLIRVAQTLGLSLQEIGEALATLPAQGTPTRKDWETLSQQWQISLDERIRNLQQLRDQLSSCIGCGCLSMKRCALYNPGDEAGATGDGPRYLLKNAHETTSQF